IKDDGAVCIDHQFPTRAFELPSIESAAGHTVADAAVALQLLGHLRFAKAIEIGGRSDTDKAQRACKRHGDHVPGDRIVGAYAGIEPAGYDIDEPPFNDDVHGHVWMTLRHLRKNLTNEKTSHHPRRVDADRSCDIAPEPRDAVERFVQRGEYGLKAAEQLDSGFRRRDTACGAVQKAHAHAFLKRTYSMAQCGRSRADLVRRASEAAV